jgi:hypothetical protein
LNRGAFHKREKEKVGQRSISLKDREHAKMLDRGAFP